MVPLEQKQPSMEELLDLSPALNLSLYLLVGMVANGYLEYNKAILENNLSLIKLSYFTFHYMLAPQESHRPRTLCHLDTCAL